MHFVPDERHVCQLLGWSTDMDHTYLALPMLGADLETILERIGAKGLPLLEATEVGRQVESGLYCKSSC